MKCNLKTLDNLKMDDLILEKEKRCLSVIETQNSFTERHTMTVKNPLPYYSSKTSFRNLAIKILCEDFVLVSRNAPSIRDCLWIKNLPDNCSKSDIMDLLSRNDKEIRVRIVRKEDSPNGECCAFVVSDWCVDAMIDMFDSVDLNGKIIECIRGDQGDGLTTKDRRTLSELRFLRALGIKFRIMRLKQRQDENRLKKAERSLNRKEYQTMTLRDVVINEQRDVRDEQLRLIGDREQLATRLVAIEQLEVECDYIGSEVDTLKQYVDARNDGNPGILPPTFQRFAQQSCVDDNVDWADIYNYRNHFNGGMGFRQAFGRRRAPGVWTRRGRERRSNPDYHTLSDLAPTYRESLEFGNDPWTATQNPTQ
ncbi:hypothetical protein ACOME3_003586 [Neoechinorhynchus agilis]